MLIFRDVNMIVMSYTQPLHIYFSLLVALWETSNISSLSYHCYCSHPFAIMPLLLFSMSQLHLKSRALKMQFMLMPQ